MMTMCTEEKVKNNFILTSLQIIIKNRRLRYCRILNSQTVAGVLVPPSAVGVSPPRGCSSLSSDPDGAGCAAAPRHFPPGCGRQTHRSETFSLVASCGVLQAACGGHLDLLDRNGGRTRSPAAPAW